MRVSQQFGVLIAAFLAVTLGCDGPDSHADAVVHGVVTFEGRPLAGGLIVFIPDRDRSAAVNIVAVEIDGSGVYHLQRDGAATVEPGWYRIAIAAPADPYLAEHTERFPRALQRPDHSGLSREVLAGHDNVFDFHIEPATETVARP